MKSRIRLLVLAIVTVSMVGCVRIDIGDSKPTLGDQLVDLYAAKKSGVITDAEFENLRDQIIRSL